MEYPLWKKLIVFLIVITAIYTALPNFFAEDSIPEFLPQKQINLGLDLRGGSHLLLEVDMKTYLEEKYASFLPEIRKLFLNNSIGYHSLKSDGNNISFTLRDVVQAEKLQELIKKEYPDFEIMVNNVNIAFAYSELEISRIKSQAMQKSLEIVRKRVDETGTKEPLVQRQGDSRILLQVPGLEDPESLKKLLGKTAKLSFHLVDMSSGGFVGVNSDKITLPAADGFGDSYVLDREALITGDMLEYASATLENGEPVVVFRLNTRGGTKFAEITTKNVGKPFAIVLDNKVISAPRINEPITGGSGIISGGYNDIVEAQELALLLRSGALPAPLKVLEQRTVGPSLGADSIEAGTLASAISMMAITVFMLIAYGKMGMIANISLIINVIIIIATLSYLGATLTLPGIAGIALTMGMAVDANVLIYERIREEMNKSNNLFVVVEKSFSRAVETIVDSNLTTLIAAFILFYFGDGAVKGFAVTLSVGIISSMFSAVSCTKLMTIAYLKRFKPKKLV
jgi:preprotein translocase subunit SecD